MDIKTYCEQIDISKLEWYQSLTEENKLSINMFDIISNSENLQNMFSDIFNFFLEEKVIWNNEKKLFITFNIYDEKSPPIPFGTM